LDEDEAPRSSAVSARIEAPKRVGRGEGVFPSSLGEGSGRGTAPSPYKCLILGLNMVSFGAFWVILFTVQLPVLPLKRYDMVPFPIIFI